MKRIVLISLALILMLAVPFAALAESKCNGNNGRATFGWSHNPGHGPAAAPVPATGGKTGATTIVPVSGK